jgi:hypothetical protein
VKGGDERRTAHHTEPTPLIFPLVAEPGPRRGWLGKVLAGGLITAVLIGGAIAAFDQLTSNPTAGKMALEAAGTGKAPDGASDVAAGRFSVFELEPGTCLRELADTDVQDVPVVHCDVEHAAEVVATVRMPDGPWPGEIAVDEFAVERCVPAIHRAGVDERPSLRWTYFGPSESSWDLRHDRTISCLVVSEDEPLTGSVINEPTTRPSSEQQVRAESMERQ